MPKLDNAPTKGDRATLLVALLLQELDRQV